MASVCLRTTSINPGLLSVPYIASVCLVTISTNPSSGLPSAPYTTSCKSETPSCKSLTAPAASIRSSLFFVTSPASFSTLLSVLTKSSLRSSIESLFLTTVATIPFPPKGSLLTSSSVAVFLLTAPVVVSTSYTSSPALKPFKVNVLL